MNYTRLPRRGVLLLDRGGDRNLLLPLGFTDLLGDMLLPLPGDGDRLLRLLGGDMLPRHLGDGDRLLRTGDLLLPRGCAETVRFSPGTARSVLLLLPPGALVSVTLGLVPVRTGCLGIVVADDGRTLLVGEPKVPRVVAVLVVVVILRLGGGLAFLLLGLALAAATAAAWKDNPVPILPKGWPAGREAWVSETAEGWVPCVVVGLSTDSKLPLANRAAVVASYSPDGNVPSTRP